MSGQDTRARGRKHKGDDLDPASIAAQLLGGLPRGSDTGESSDEGAADAAADAAAAAAAERAAAAAERAAEIDYAAERAAAAAAERAAAERAAAAASMEAAAERAAAAQEQSEVRTAFRRMEPLSAIARGDVRLWLAEEAWVPEVLEVIATVAAELSAAIGRKKLPPTIAGALERLQAFALRYGAM